MLQFPHKKWRLYFMDKEKQMLLNYVANTLLVEKLHRFYEDLLKPTATSGEEKRLREDMLVAQYRLLEEQNANIMLQLLLNKENRRYLMGRTHNFSLEPTEFDFDVLSPGIQDTRILPFAKNYRKVDFIEELEKLVKKNLLRRYGERVLNEHKSK